MSEPPFIIRPTDPADADLADAASVIANRIYQRAGPGEVVHLTDVPAGEPVSYQDILTRAAGAFGFPRFNAVRMFDWAAEANRDAMMASGATWADSLAHLSEDEREALLRGNWETEDPLDSARERIAELETEGDQLRAELLALYEGRASLLRPASYGPDNAPALGGGA